MPFNELLRPSRAMDRREFLTWMGAVGKATGVAFIGLALNSACKEETLLTEPVSSSREVDLNTVDLILPEDEDFAQRDLKRVIQGEIVPRLKITPPYDSSGLGVRNRNKINYSARTDFSSDYGNFTLAADFHYRHGYDFTIIFEQAATNDKYLFRYGNKYDTQVVSGETVSEERAKGIRDNLTTIFVDSFNEAIKKGDILTIVESYDRKITPTPPSAQD